MSDETVLVLGDIEIPVGAGRGITQSLTIISNGDLRRTVNGTLTDTTRVTNQKYSSSIKCSDQSTPPLTGIWKGTILDVECISKLRQDVATSTTATLTRTPVDDSIVGYDETGLKVEPNDVDDLDITFDVDVLMIEYRPMLTMMVTSHSIDDDEYQATEGWQIDLEEV